ncbi:MAG: ParB/RepB/Spo0J family partition protein, partial [Candidatus Eisenbacteria bacterium]|nr:ParB/RepB/Spo0J family partition protein [Candidatus Eisenbacteria bacterium]
MTRKALGRGLEALIPRQASPEPGRSMQRAGAVATNEAGGQAAETRVAIERIRPNPWQPRKSVDPAKMEELVSSVRLRGVLEPLLVRRSGEGFELVAGERRLRAAQEAGLNEVPIVIVDLTDKESLEVALVENLQREDLNPIDEARAYQLLAEEFGRTHDEIARQVGKERS